MPYYEYRCMECGHEWEQWQKIIEEPIKDCPKCGASKAQRLICNTSFILKGTGWYVTDYKNKGKETSPKESRPPKDDRIDKESKVSSLPSTN